MTKGSDWLEKKPNWYIDMFWPWVTCVTSVADVKINNSVKSDIHICICQLDWDEWCFIKSNN